MHYMAITYFAYYYMHDHYFFNYICFHAIPYNSRRLQALHAKLVDPVILNLQGPQV